MIEERRLDQGVDDLRRTAHPFPDEPERVELRDEDLLHVMLRDRRDVEVGHQQVADALEGDQRLDHEHHLDREVHVELGASAHRLEDELGEREVAEVRLAAPAADDLLDLAPEADARRRRAPAGRSS